MKIETFKDAREPFCLPSTFGNLYAIDTEDKQQQNFTLDNVRSHSYNQKQRSGKYFPFNEAVFMRSEKIQAIKLIEDFIDEYHDMYGSSPTIMDIEAGTGLSKSAIGRYLIYMRENGLVEYNGRRNVTTARRQKERGQTLKVPVLGRVSCGIPRFAEENIEEYVRLPVSLFGHGEFFFLRANGNSMIEAGICDGDLVLIRHQDYAESGQIVVALTDDEATLKRYYPEPEHRRIRLHPENPQMDDIYVDDCTVQGVAVKVIKDIG